MREKASMNLPPKLTFLMVRQCDLKIPCHTCETKDRRKFPKKCIRTDFDWESHGSTYFPGMYRIQPFTLTSR